jgi:hypothetical protein
MDLSQVYGPELYDDTSPNHSKLDSHADTCVAGANTIPLWYTDQRVNVSPFIGDYTPIADVPIASVATAWDDPTNGRTIILVINEALFFGERMTYLLLCPNQMRCNGLIVNDVPPLFNPDFPHSIVIPGKLELPLKMRGVMSYLETHKPTMDEISKCEHFELTSTKPWDPHAMNLDLTPTLDGLNLRQIHLVQKRDPLELHISSLTTLSIDLKAINSPSGLQSNVHEADVIGHEAQHREMMATVTSSKSSTITKEELSLRWFISDEVAAQTL